VTLETAFVEVALTLLAATAVGAIGLWLRQPLIVSFIAVGVLVGPTGVGLVTRHEQIELLASVGIALLLFVVGLKLDVQTIRTLGPMAAVAGVGQVVVTSVIGFLLAQALGMEKPISAYVAMALTFSSTVMVVKFLSDAREINALHGRIVVGVLIVQDLAVIFAMIGITAFTAVRQVDQTATAHAVPAVLNGLGALVAVVILSRLVLPRLSTFLARVPELLVLFGIAWAVVLAAGMDALGLGKEIGAFVAGASLASTPYRELLASRLTSLRDFLLLFFFIDLGARVDPSMLRGAVGASLVLSTFVLVGKPLIVMAIVGRAGYRKRTGFLAGLSLGQVSEFSLILGALGVSVGHIGPDTLGLITTVGLITIGVSSYLVVYSGPLYDRVSSWLGVFERSAPLREGAAEARALPKAEVVVFGIGRYGSGIARHLLRRGRSVVGVDFDPEALDRGRTEGVPMVYGDASDPDVVDYLPLDTATWVVSTAPDFATSRTLLHHLRQRGFRGRVALACRTAAEGEHLQVEGADVLLRPYADAAEQAVDALTSAADRLGALAGVTPGLRELRLASASQWAGHRIEQVPLREQFGVTILAVSRGGHSTFNPGPAFQIFPGDRLLLSGEPHRLAQATTYLERVDAGRPSGVPEDFHVEKIRAGSLAGWTGHSLATLEVPARWALTVLALSEDGERWTAPDPERPLADGDLLVLGGSAANFVRLPWRHGQGGGD